MTNEKTLFVEARILRYLSHHPEGLSSEQISGWLGSIKKFEVTFLDADATLAKLRNAGQIAVANELWYVRGQPLQIQDDRAITRVSNEFDVEEKQVWLF